MSKLVLNLQIRLASGEVIETGIRVHDEKSWHACRRLILAKALGNCSRSAYVLVGRYDNTVELAKGNPVSVRDLVVLGVAGRIATWKGRGYASDIPLDDLEGSFRSVFDFPAWLAALDVLHVDG